MIKARETRQEGAVGRVKRKRKEIGCIQIGWGEEERADGVE